MNNTATTTRSARHAGMRTRPINSNPERPGIDSAAEAKTPRLSPCGGTRPLLAVLVLAVIVPLGAMAAAAAGQSYPVVDTAQSNCYDDGNQIACPAAGAAFHGQDAQNAGNQPSYAISADGLTVDDNVTGLTWTRSPDLDGDGNVDLDDKLTFYQAPAYADMLNAQSFGGYSDWRVPTIKELYSLIDFRGTDPMINGTDPTGLIPFIDTDYFAFGYGDTAAGERIIDSQWVTSTLYTADNSMMFGVNFADGRIKGYGMTQPGGDKLFYVRLCRGNADYGKNVFVDNGDGTVTDEATGLTWSQTDDGGDGMNWQDALAWVSARNNESYLGHSDWRLPNAKELHSLLDYTRSPNTTGSAAIDPMFSATQITNEAGEPDYPFYWTSTSFLRANGGAPGAVYVAFGRGLGTYDGVNVVDAHGAGCQRSDPKDGDPSDFPNWGDAPQGDVQRVFNHVRWVRDAGSAPAAPSELAATALSTTEIELSWLDNSNDEEEFRIEMRIGDGELEDIGSVAAGVTGGVVDSLQPETDYTFRIRARSGAGDSAYSNEASATTLAGPSDCVPDDQALCLNGGRFRVEIRWRNFADQEGPARVVEVDSDESGLFYFFTPDNWEMLLKVLDGCAYNGHYWVFAAATTNVEYTLRVTDTQTGELQEYFNPLGTASPAITDTKAFATCP